MLLAINFIICLIGFSEELNSNRIWSLQECINQAYSCNVSIEKLNNEEKSAKVSIAEAKSEFIPSISAGANYSLSSGRVLDQTTYSFLEHSTVGSSSISITGTAILFSGLERYYRVKQAQKEYDAFVMNSLSMRKEVCKNVVLAFYNVLCADKNIESAHLIANLITEQLLIIEAQVDAGIKTEADLLQIRSQLCSAQNDIILANNAKKMALLELGQLMNISDYSLIRLQNDDENDLQQVYNTDANRYEISFHNLPEYRTEELRVESAKYAVKVAKSSYYPTLLLSGSYGSNFSSARQKVLISENDTYQNIKYPPFEQWADNANAYITLTLQIPIFNGMRVRNNVKRAELGVKDAYYTMSIVRNKVAKEFEQIRGDNETAYQRYVSATEQLKYTSEVLRQIKEQYEYGKCDFITWNIAIVEYAKAQYEVNNTKYALISSRKLLQTYYNIN